MMVKCSGREELAFCCIRAGHMCFHNNPEFNNLSLIVRVMSDTLKMHGPIANPVLHRFLCISLH